MGTVRITEAEAIRNIAGLLARAQNGEEIVIQTASAPVVLRKAEEPHLRRLSESLRIAQEEGSTVTLDGEFEKDLNAVIESHSEPLANPWD